jgi:hypothetical protein
MLERPELGLDLVDDQLLHVFRVAPGYTAVI